MIERTIFTNYDKWYNNMEGNDDSGGKWLSPRKTIVKERKAKAKVTMADEATIVSIRNPTQKIISTSTTSTNPTQRKMTEAAASMQNNNNDHGMEIETNTVAEEKPKQLKSILYNSKYKEEEKEEESEKENEEKWTTNEKNQEETSSMTSYNGDTAIIRIEIPYAKNGQPEYPLTEYVTKISEAILQFREDIEIVALNSCAVMHFHAPTTTEEMFEEYFQYDVSTMGSKRDQTSIFMQIGWEMLTKCPIKRIINDHNVRKVATKYNAYLYKHTLPLETVKSIGLIFYKHPEATNATIQSKLVNEDIRNFLNDRPDLANKLKMWNGVSDLIDIIRRSFTYRKYNNKNSPEDVKVPCLDIRTSKSHQKVILEILDEMKLDRRYYGIMVSHSHKSENPEAYNELIQELAIEQLAFLQNCYRFTMTGLDNHIMELFVPGSSDITYFQLIFNKKIEDSDDFLFSDIILADENEGKWHICVDKVHKDQAIKTAEEFAEQINQYFKGHAMETYVSVRADRSTSNLFTRANEDLKDVKKGKRNEYYKHLSGSNYITKGLRKPTICPPPNDVYFPPIPSNGNSTTVKRSKEDTTEISETRDPKRASNRKTPEKSAWDNLISSVHQNKESDNGIGHHNKESDDDSGNSNQQTAVISKLSSRASSYKSAISEMRTTIDELVITMEETREERKQDRINHEADRKKEREMFEQLLRQQQEESEKRLKQQQEEFMSIINQLMTRLNTGNTVDNTMRMNTPPRNNIVHAENQHSIMSNMTNLDNYSTPNDNTTMECSTPTESLNLVRRNHNYQDNINSNPGEDPDERMENQEVAIGTHPDSHFDCAGPHG
jgi:hypothetical protein